jgi:hypothetical protein
MFTPSDTRTTSQLLGNPAIRQLLAQAGRIDRREQKALNRLDLRRQNTLIGGPYLWFNFVSRACSHSVAMLLVEYNRHAIPRHALGRYNAEQRHQYERWLNRDNPPEEQSAPANTQGEPTYATTAFTALHFLDNDAQRDQKIKQRFGEAVLQRLREDRKLMVRRIFGTYPMHEAPKEQRVVNPYTFYQKYLARGRALLLPLFAGAMATRSARWLLGWIIRSVREISDPAKRLDIMDAAQGDFRTAVRKINRVRLPVVLAALRLRAQLDPEYLGAAIPGQPWRDDQPIQVDADRQFLDLDVDVVHELDHHRRRSRADMRRLQTLIDQGLLHRAAERLGLDAHAFDDPRHRRAAAIAYAADYDGVRRHLSATTLCREVFTRATDEAQTPRALHLQWRLRRAFNRYWQKCDHVDTHDRAAKRAAWAAVQQNEWGVADALRAWARFGDEAPEEGERRLSQLLQHAERLCEQLSSLRAVQTLSVLDVLHYRQHVFALGGYGDEEQPPAELLHWHTSADASVAHGSETSAA